MTSPEFNPIEQAEALFTNIVRNPNGVLHSLVGEFCGEPGLWTRVRRSQDMCSHNLFLLANEAWQGRVGDFSNLKCYFETNMDDKPKVSGLGICAVGLEASISIGNVEFGSVRSAFESDVPIRDLDGLLMANFALVYSSAWMGNDTIDNHEIDDRLPLLTLAKLSGFEPLL
jgi:hypothetical protein